VGNFLRPQYLQRSEWSDHDRDVNAGRRFRPLLKSDIMMKAVSPEDGKIVGCAVWTQPSVAPDYVHTEVDENSRDLQVDYERQGKFKKALAEFRKKTMGTQKHWNLVSISTHKDYLKQGVAGALIDWGLAQAAKEDLPTMLESVPTAQVVYIRKGFEYITDFTLDYEVKDEQGRLTGETDNVILKIMVRQPQSKQ